MPKSIVAFQRVLDPEDNKTGGGAASAVAGAMGAALIGMVARLSIGREGLKPEAFYRQIDAEAQSLADNLIDGAEADSAAFDTVMAAYRAPKHTPEEKQSRSEAIQRAILHATEVPLGNAHWNAKALALCAQLAGCSNPNAASDLECAFFLVRAGLQGALSNIQINLLQIKDEQIVEQIRADVKALQTVLDRFAPALESTTEV